MGKNQLFISLLALVFCVSACKSEFETVRSKGSAGERLALANRYLEEEQCFKAQSLYESVIGAYRGLPEQEGIYFKYAQSHYCQGSYMSAAHYFQNFASTYPHSDKKEEASFMSAYSYYQMSPNYKLDQTYTQKAINEFQVFVNSYPNSKRTAECNKLIDECRAKLEKKAYHEGKLYLDMQQYEAARVSFKNLLNDFPETDSAEKVRYFIVKAGYNWAVKSVLVKQEERFEYAATDAETFLARHTVSGYTKEVRGMLEASKARVKELNDSKG